MPSTVHAGDWIELDLSGFQPKTAYLVNDASGFPDAGYTTDANGSDVMSIQYPSGASPGPRRICVTQVGGTSACQQLVLTPPIRPQAGLIAVLLGLLTSVGLVVAARSGAKGSVLRLPRNGGRRKGLGLLAYGLATGLLLLVPFAVFALAATVRALVSRPFRSRLKLIGSPRRWRRVAGWILWAIALCLVLGASGVVLGVALSDNTLSRAGQVQGLMAINAVFLAPVALIGLYIAAWNLVGVTPTPPAASGQISTRLGDEPAIPQSSRLSRYVVRFSDLLRPLPGLDYVALVLFPPIGIARLKLKTTTGSLAGSWWVFVVASWIGIFAAIAMLIGYDTVFAGDVEWSDWLSLLLRYLIGSSLLLFLVWLARHSYSQATVPPSDSGSRAVRDAESEPQPSDISFLAGFRQALLMAISLTAWLIFLLIASWPWIQVEVLAFASRNLETTTSWVQNMASFGSLSPARVLAIGRLAAVFLAAVPVVAVSLRVVVEAVHSQSRRASASTRSDGVSHLPVVISALITAVTFVFVGALVEYSTVLVETGLGEALTVLVTGICIGLSTGLSIGMARRFGVSQTWSERSLAVSTTGFCLLLVFTLVALTEQEWSAHAPVPSLTSIAVPAAGVTGLSLGFIIGDRILIPGFVAFSETAEYLQELFWPLIGFVAGYVFIVLAFGGLYFAVQQSDCISGHSANFSAPQKVCSLEFQDFVFFSVNTVAPLGYSELRPAGDSMKAVATLELGAGIGWTLVVFGAVLARLNDRHVRTIVEDALGLGRTDHNPGLSMGATPPDLAARLRSPRLGLNEQWSLVDRLERSIRLPAERETSIQLIRQFLERKDLYYRPANRLRALAAEAAGTAQGRSASPAYSKTFIAVTALCLLLTAAPPIQQHIPAIGPAPSGELAIGDSCVVGHWKLQQATTADAAVDLDFTGQPGATLDVSGDGSAVYSSGSKPIPMVAYADQGQRFTLTLTGTMAAMVEATQQQFPPGVYNGLWRQSESWSKSYELVVARQGVIDNSITAQPTSMQTYQCRPNMLTVNDSDITVTYVR